MDVSYITLYAEQNLTALAHAFQSYNDMCISAKRKRKKKGPLSVIRSA